MSHAFYKLHNEPKALESSQPGIFTRRLGLDLVWVLRFRKPVMQLKSFQRPSLKPPHTYTHAHHRLHAPYSAIHTEKFLAALEMMATKCIYIDQHKR